MEIRLKGNKIESETESKWNWKEVKRRESETESKWNWKKVKLKGSETEKEGKGE